MLETTRAGLDTVTQRLGRVPDELTGLRERHEAARGASARVETLQASLGSWTSRLAAAHEADSLTVSLGEAQAALHEVAEQRLLAREDLVEIRERRLDGMAAEIACQLAVGASCPVCGSADHPSPATRSSGAPDEAAERRARKDVDDLEAVVEAHTQQVRGLETRVAAARATADGSVAELSDAVSSATADLDAATVDAREVAVVTEQVRRLEAEQSRLARRAGLPRVDGDRAGDDAGRPHRATRHAAGRCRGRARRPRPRRPGLAGASRAAHRRLRVAMPRGQRRGGTARGRQPSEPRRTRTRAAVEAGFESAAQAALAWLSPTSLGALELRIEQHERDLRHVLEVLADPHVSAAASVPPPDLEALARAHHDARAAAAATRRTLDAMAERRDRLARLADELDAALAAWEPTRADLDVVSELASFVEGKHPDNRLQMRLSAYVLAHRLGQVVAAANLRLASMSDHRYSLVHTGRRGAGETRGGLSLLVRDDWSGESRDPATLSGGETFVVSLALALGLADVITDEVGGADLDTLFVDEGFGSLDADTLEDVMDTLDTLRDGGRVVGVVSHVPELQTRIPTQLRVHKGRHGSRTSVRLG